jgi:hypothetical protein
MDLVVSVACHSVGGCYIDSMGIDMVDGTAVRAFAGLSGNRAVGILHITPPAGQARRRRLAWKIMDIS